MGSAYDGYHMYNWAKKHGITIDVSDVMPNYDLKNKCNYLNLRI